MKHLHLPLLLSCGLLLLPATFSQNSQPLDSLEARVEGLFAEKKYDEVIALVQPFSQKAGEEGDWRQFSECAANLAQAYHLKKEHEQSLAVVQTAINKLKEAGEGNSLFSANLWVWKALEHNRLDQFDQSLESYQSAIKIYESNHFIGPKLAYSYKNAAQIYFRYSNDRKAINYLETALRSDTSHSQNASAYAQLASLYIDLDSAALAQKYYDLGRAETTAAPQYQASLNFSGAMLALKKSDLENARYYALQALRYYESEPTLGDNRIRTLTALADIAARQHNPREAEQYFQKAEAEGKKFYTGKSREMAKLYVETGLFYEKNGQPNLALGFYQKALVQAFPNFNSLNINDNPALEEAWLESQAMRAAAAKAKVLFRPPQPPREGEMFHPRHIPEKSKQSASPPLGGAGRGETFRLTAAHCFDLSFAVAARLRRTYGNDADKFALAANNRHNYTAAALNLWQLWRETADPAVLARLFAFLEQTKAQALGDALQQQRALALTDIPNTLLAREENLRLEAAIAAKDLKEKELSGDSAAVVRLKDRAFQQEKAYDDFLGALKKQHPQFSQYTQAGLSADLAAIQSALPDTAALLSWFDAGDRYLCVAVRCGGLSAYEVPRDSLLDKVLPQFLVTLADKSQQERDPAAYFSDAHFLFQKLLPDAALLGVRSLIIIPDGQLCYLPFEALLTAPHTGNFANAPYLLRSKTVQYAWSATLLTLPAAANPAENGLLQIAPFAKSARDGLAILPNSLRDTPDGIGATVLDGEEATTDEFLNRAPRHNVLHLSTHADAGGRDVPGIEFYDRRLTLPEVYAQRFHASLVSLSACETGKGHFADGEGVLSLARAFAYAGAQSLVASHWQVNERSTTELFSIFYKNLESGLPKAEALRQAKLRYLASSEMDARKAPFHWAAFTLTGTDGQVNLKNSRLWVWLSAAGGLLLLAVVFWRQRRVRV